MDCEIKDEAYWLTKAERRRKSRSNKTGKKTRRKKKKKKDRCSSGSESDSSADVNAITFDDRMDRLEAGVTANQESIKEALKLVMQQEERLATKMDGKLKEQRQEIEQDVVAPLKLQMDRLMVP